MTGEPEAGPAPRRRLVTRTRVLAGGLALVVLAGGAGWLAGSRIASPAEVAARAEAPEPSLITVAVERRTLSADIVTRGDVGFSDPVDLVVAGPLGAEGARQVVTRVVEEGTELAEGDPVLEVVDRPVLLLQGTLPSYRDLRPGATGADVLQLEQALVRLGHLSSADDRWTGDTGAAVQSLYAVAGYVPNAADDAEADALDAARQRVQAATRALRQVEAAAAAGGPARSALLQARADVAAAQEALHLARTEQHQADAAAARAVDAARTAADAAATTAAAAEARVAAAGTALDPVTGEPLTPAEVAVLEDERAQAVAAVTAARNALADAEAAVALTAEQGRAAVAAAARQVGITEAQLQEVERPAAPAEDAGPSRAEAQEELRAANEELAELSATTGTWLPAGEVAYVPAVPVQVATLATELGAVVATAPFMTVSGATTGMRVGVTAGDLERLAVGDTVVVDEPDLAAPLSGTVATIPEPGDRAPADGGDGGDGGGEEDGGSSGGREERVEIEVALTGLPPELIGANVRVVIPVESTAGEVLVVPAAALSAVADGDVRVQVEDDDGTTRFVTVETGLASGGDVEIRPLDGELDEGDRVVVGLEGASGSGSEPSSPASEDADA